MSSHVSDEVAQKILSGIQIEELSTLALNLARINSPRGFENEVGEYIYKWMLSNRFKCFKQEAAPGRNNVVGILEGTEGHPRLVFNSHMDIGFDLPEDIWTCGPEILPFVEGSEHEGVLIGRSIVNDKGHMAAFLIAAKAIKESGIRLKGDIVLSCVVGEIGQAPIDEFKGSRYEGMGFGTRHLVSHGVVGDYAIVAERTNFAVSRAEAGVAWFKISVLGRIGGMYMPYLERPYSFKDNPNAIVKAAKVIEAIEEWAYNYQKQHSQDFEDGVIVPKINIGAIKGGLPPNADKVVSLCAIYVDVRLAPGQSPESAREELETVVKRCEVEFSIELYLYHPGYIGKNVDELVKAVELAHEKVLGKKVPTKVAEPYSSMWRDLNVFNEAGIPAITFGAPGTVGSLVDQTMPGIKQQVLTDAAKIYALAALELCG